MSATRLALVLWLLAAPSWAASPVVAATNTSTSTGTTHTANLPSGIVSGNLLIVKIGCDGDPAITWTSTGFTEFFEKAFTGGAVIMALAYRQADGGEGSTIDITTDVAEKCAHLSYRITGAEDPATQVPEVSTGATGTSTTPDPDSLTPTGGSADFLWLAMHVHEGDATTDAFPASYSNGISIEEGSAGGAGLGSAERQLTASSEDPATFTISGSEKWVAPTVAIHPSDGVVARRRANPIIF